LALPDDPSLIINKAIKRVVRIDKRPNNLPVSALTSSDTFEDASGELEACERLFTFTCVSDLTFTCPEGQAIYQSLCFTVIGDMVVSMQQSVTEL